VAIERQKIAAPWPNLYSYSLSIFTGYPLDLYPEADPDAIPPTGRFKTALFHEMKRVANSCWKAELASSINRGSVSVSDPPCDERVAQNALIDRVTIAIALVTGGAFLCWRWLKWHTVRGGKSASPEARCQDYEQGQDLQASEKHHEGEKVKGRAGYRREVFYRPDNWADAWTDIG
jgi:hypothetical protein